MYQGKYNWQFDCIAPSLTLFSSSSFLEKDDEHLSDVKVKMGSYVDVTVGYAPKSPYNALKGSISINNLILKRFGFYTSLEKGLNKDALVFHDYDGHTYFTHILGLTASLNKNIYFFGGIDLFTKSGVIYTKDKLRGFRKELGIGIAPYRGTIIRLGWSGSVGPTFAIGAKFPLHKRENSRP